jgi:uncharacterized protein involved in outer membrane biogenesis
VQKGGTAEDSAVKNPFQGDTDTWTTETLGNLSTAGSSEQDVLPEGEKITYGDGGEQVTEEIKHDDLAGPSQASADAFTFEVLNNYTMEEHVERINDVISANQDILSSLLELLRTQVRDTRSALTGNITIKAEQKTSATTILSLLAGP